MGCVFQRRRVSATTRILIVSEAASSHTARWINQLAGSDFEPHLFQAGQPCGVNPLLRYGVVHYPGQTPVPAGVTLKPYRPEPDQEGPLACVPALADLLHKLDPALIHSHGLNINWCNLMLPVAKALAESGGEERWPWLFSSWGTDLDFWPEISLDHKRGVAEVLPRCRFMTNECLRDALLARRFGFSGRFLGLFPDYGGVDFTELEELGALPAPLDRWGIFLKGRDVGCPGGDPVGRAMVAMDAFALAGDVLKDVPILIAQASPNVRARAEKLAQEGFRISVLAHLPYADLLQAMASCSIFMAMTSNDGLPSSLVEALALGLFPIHSDMEPIREWVQHGHNGLLVAHNDAYAAADALCWAVQHGARVRQAGRKNESLMRKLMNISTVRRAVIGLYETVAKAGRRVPGPGGSLEDLPDMQTLLHGDNAFRISKKYWLGQGV